MILAIIIELLNNIRCLSTSDGNLITWTSNKQIDGIQIGELVFAGRDIADLGFRDLIW